MIPKIKIFKFQQKKQKQKKFEKKPTYFIYY